MNLSVSSALRSNYKWYILVLAMLTYGLLAGSARMCLPVLFKEISTDLNLSPVSLGTIWGMDPLAGIFVGLPSGLLVDRFGIKRTLTVVCLLGALFCALRGFSSNFATLAVTTFFFGAMTAMTPTIVPKAAAVWFERRQFGLTNALLNIASSLGGMAVTMTAATVLSPALGGWRNVLFLLAGPPIVIGLLWLFTGREPARSETQYASASGVPLRESLSQVIRNREVWVIGLILFVVMGGFIGFAGYFPLYLRNIGWSTVAADGAFTAYNGAFMAGVIPMTLLANRLRNYTGVFFVSLAITVVLFGLVPFVNGAALWVLVIVGNFLRAGIFTVSTVMVFDIPGIGKTYGGTAMGLTSSIGMAGACLAPPLGNSFADFSPGAPFFFWAGLSVIGLPLFLFLRKRPVIS